jgi:hypothetical protein
MIFKTTLNNKSRARIVAVTVLFIILVQLLYTNLKDSSYAFPVFATLLVIVNFIVIKRIKKAGNANTK